jgi:hypothetical protein
MRSVPSWVWQAAGWTLGLGTVGTVGYFLLRGQGLVFDLPRAAGDDFFVNYFTSTTTKAQFVQTVMDAAGQADPTLSPTARMLIAAQGALESGWGRSPAAKQANNLFNVSAGRGWSGPTMPGPDVEYTAGSSVAKSITQQWRVYGDPAGGVADFLKLLRAGYINYAEADLDLRAGLETYATRLGVFEFGSDGKTIVRVDNRPNTAGYYTAPRSKYQAGVSSLFREIQALAAANANVAGLSLSGVKV